MFVIDCVRRCAECERARARVRESVCRAGRERLVQLAGRRSADEERSARALLQSAGHRPRRRLKSHILDRTRLWLYRCLHSWYISISMIASNLIQYMSLAF